MGRRHQDYSPDRTESRSYRSSSRNETSTRRSRGRKIERSSSRSQSRSSSRSRSSSESPRRSHSRSRSNDSRRTKKHKKNRGSSHSKKEHRRSDDRNRSQDRDSEDQAMSKHRRDGSSDQQKSDRRQSNTAVNAMPSSNIKTLDETHSDNDPSDEGYQQRNPDVDSKSSKKFKPDDIDDMKLIKESRKITLQPVQSEKPDRRTSKERSYTDPELIKEDPERFYPTETRYEASPSAVQAGRYSMDEGCPRDREYRETGRKRSRSPLMRNPLSPGRMLRERDGGRTDDDFNDPKLHIQEREVFQRASRPDGRYVDDPRRIPENAVQGQKGRYMAQAVRSPPPQDPPPMRPRSRRSYDGDDVYERGMMRDYDDPRSTMRREGHGEEFEKRRHLDEGLPMRDVRRDYYDDRIRMDVGGFDKMVSDRGMPVLDRTPVSSVPTDRIGGGRVQHMMERERSPFDDRGSTGSGPSHHSSIPRSYNGTVTRDIDKATLNLSLEKMALVKEKKEEVEKSFRQDCETFAAVTKMLIGKDSSLEDKLQACLRENLKDIGQRCIHELREYIESLRGDDMTQ